MSKPETTSRRLWINNSVFSFFYVIGENIHGIKVSDFGFILVPSSYVIKQLIRFQNVPINDIFHWYLFLHRTKYKPSRKTILHYNAVIKLSGISCSNNKYHIKILENLKISHGPCMFWKTLTVSLVSFNHPIF